MQVFPVIGVVPVLSNACTEYEEAGPTVVPLAAIPVTVTVAVVFPLVAAVTDGAPGATTVHCAYKIVSA